MHEVLTRSRGATAARHWAAEGENLTLCRRHVVLLDALLPGATISRTTDCMACAARRQDAVLREQERLQRETRGLWKARNRETGALEPILIADMADSHVIAALALTERRATERGLTGEESWQFRVRRWPALPLLIAEALRRFGPDWNSHVVQNAERSEKMQNRTRAIRVRPEEDF
jgi:hypothetical protein